MTFMRQTSLDFSKTQNQFLSVMFGIGGTTGGNKSGSIGASKGSSDRQWVDNMASIIGTESVDIDVDGKLKLDGSVIANTDLAGNDKGNLDIKVGSLEANDIHNFNNSSETGFGLAESTGPANDGTNDGRPKGASTVHMVDKGSVNESTTHATIGKGNIEVADGSDISGINRDVNKTETVTKDEITGALDATVTIDNRIITDGFAQWWNDVFEAPAEEYEQRKDEQNKYFKEDYKGEEKELGLLPTLGLEKSYVGQETYVLGTNDYTDAYKTKYAVRKEGNKYFDQNNNELPPQKYTEGKNERGETIYFQTPEQLSLTQKLSSTFDVNPAFKFLSAIIPGFSSDAKVHDAQYEGEKRDEVLQKSIIPSFIATDYSIIFGKLPSLLKEKTSKDNEQTNKGGK